MSMRARRLLLAAAGLVCLAPWMPPPLALAIGALTSPLVAGDDAQRVRRLAHHLLAASVVALGAGVDLCAIADVGIEGAVMTAGTIALCLGLGAALTRALGIAPRVGLLVAAGTAICGGSAIAAMAPVVRARDEETSVALGTVFVLNAVAMLCLPVLGRALGLDASRFGLLAALAVHDTSSVVGAAIGFGEEAVAIATTVKLARATWIVPLVLVTAAFASRGRDAARVRRRELPWFVLAFVACAALFSLVPGLADLGDAISGGARRFMVLTLFLVGAGLSREGLRRTGPRPLLLGVLLWATLAVVAIALVR